MADMKQNGTGNPAANGQNGYRVIGTRPVRPDGVDKVTGRAVYAADVQMTGLLHGFVLRSPHAHAYIRSIDTSKAEAFPGVRAVVTAADLPEAEDKVEDLGEGAINLKYLSDNVLADAEGALPRARRGRRGRRQPAHCPGGRRADRSRL